MSVETMRKLMQLSQTEDQLAIVKAMLTQLIGKAPDLAVLEAIKAAQAAVDVAQNITNGAIYRVENS